VKVLRKKEGKRRRSEILEKKRGREKKHQRS
jgi:hypothetical protein